MALFDQIKALIKEDIEQTKNTEDEDLLYIEEETENTIYIYDDLDGFSRRYSITDPDTISRQWILDRIVITDSVADAGVTIDKDQLAGWIFDNVDKNMLLTLEYIILSNDCEDDFDFLEKFNPDKFGQSAEMNTLPDESQLGIMWFNDQVVAASVGGITNCIDEIIESGYIEDWERMSAINNEIVKTIVHEIRHLAQANPYLPEDILLQDGNDEQDAESYACKVCEENGFPYIISDCWDAGKDEEEYDADL